MPIQPKFKSGSSNINRVFTDRKDLISFFHQQLSENSFETHNIISYYGIGGIGKTSLRKELIKLLNNHNNKYITASIDFDLPAYRQEETALYYLRKTLKDKYKIHFPSFEIAYTVYWQKTHPQTAITKETLPLLEEGGIAASMVSTLGNIPLVGLIPGITTTVLKGHKIFKEWWAKRGEKELLTLPELEAKEILERLPMFFANDLNDYLTETGLVCVFFIDTYEALWEQPAGAGGFFMRDEWVRELVAQLPSPLWVIFGREMLRWQEVESDWGNYIQNKLIGSLSDNDSERFLRGCGIDNENILKHVISSGKGVPYFLDISVDTFYQIKQKYNREPVDKDFAENQSEVMERFLRYLDKTEIETLKVLSVPRFWDSGIFRLLITEFQTGYPLTAMHELCRFSFIAQDNTENTFTIQGLMKDGLLSKTDFELKESIHKLLYEYYTSKLTGIKVNNISSYQEIAFAEAFYHGRNLIDIQVFTNWFFNIVSVFYEAGKWKLLMSMCEIMLNILKEKYGENGPDFIRTLNLLGSLFERTGNYTTAIELHSNANTLIAGTIGETNDKFIESLNFIGLDYKAAGKYKEAITVFEKAIKLQKDLTGEKCSEYANSVNNLASVYYEAGNITKAGEMYENALSILTGTSGTKHRDYAGVLNNLANIYFKSEKFEKAAELHENAISILQAEFGDKNPRLAVSFNNLANVYARTGQFDNALYFLNKALDIRKNSLGEEHPLYAASLNNLANVYAITGKNEQALELFEQSAELRKKTLGENHPEYAQSLNNLGSIYSITGNLEEAVSIFEKAMNIRSKFTGENSPEFAAIACNLAAAYLMKGNYDKSLKLYDQSLMIYEEDKLKYGGKISAILQSIKDIYIKTGRDTIIIDNKIKDLPK